MLHRKRVLQQQQRAIENIIKHGWKGVDLRLHLDAVSQVEEVAPGCVKKGDWVLDHIEEELAFMRGADFRRQTTLRGAASRIQMQRCACQI